MITMNGSTCGSMAARWNASCAICLAHSPSSKLEFETAVNRNTPRFQQFWRLLLFFAEQLNATTEPLFFCL